MSGAGQLCHLSTRQLLQKVAASTAALVASGDASTLSGTARAAARRPLPTPSSAAPDTVIASMSTIAESLCTTSMSIWSKWRSSWYSLCRRRRLCGSHHRADFLPRLRLLLRLCHVCAPRPLPPLPRRSPCAPSPPSALASLASSSTSRRFFSSSARRSAFVPPCHRPPISPPTLACTPPPCELPSVAQALDEQQHERDDDCPHAEHPEHPQEEIDAPPACMSSQGHPGVLVHPASRLVDLNPPFFLFL